MGIWAGHNTDILDNTISFGDRYTQQCGFSNYGNYHRAIDVDDRNHHIIRNNTITNFARGIELNNSTDNIVDSNYIHTTSYYVTTSGSN